MTKRITDIQLQGQKGEKIFEYLAPMMRLLPTKIVPDEGIDYVCQVIGERTDKQSFFMTGDYIAVCVRSSNKEEKTIQISRDDADHIIATSLPVVLVIIDLYTAGLPGYYIRVLDTQFITELFEFLKGCNKTLTIRADKCISDPEDIKLCINRSLKPGEREKNEVLKRELKIKHIIPGASYESFITSKTSLSLVKLPYFMKLFNFDNPETKILVSNAIFGREEFLSKRLSSLPVRKDFLDVIRDLPSPVVVSGPPFRESETILKVKSQKGEASCKFKVRGYDEWIGYCHDSGLTLKISKAVERDGQHVHLTEYIVDPDVKVVDIIKSDLKPFLNYSRDNAKIILNKNKFSIPCHHFPVLNAFGWLCEYLDCLQSESYIDIADWKADNVSEEDLQSLNILWRLKKNKNLFQKFGFTISKLPFEQLVHHRVLFKIPLCFNFRKQGIVCWLKADGEFLTESEDLVNVGLRILHIHSRKIEKKSRSFPTGGFPAFKVCPEWPAIRINSKSIYSTGYDDWGVCLETLQCTPAT